MRRLIHVIKRLLRGAPPPSAPPPARYALWSIGLFTGTSPLALAPGAITNPIITRDNVTDVPASFVADPFLVRAGATWHLFFEVLNRRSGRGEIGLATSDDLARWQYQRIVLAEPFHLSYPQVFEWQGAYYMVPETQEVESIRLYRADTLTGEWKHVHTLLEGQLFCDSTVVRHDERWWLFTQTTKTHDNLRLFFADDLFGTWTEHPASPLVERDPHRARPAGRVVPFAGGLLRFAQDCAPQYGLRVLAFEITKLTVSDYVEQPANPHAILEGRNAGWNASRMHHIDAHCLGPDAWIAAVDGARNTTMADINRTA